MPIAREFLDWRQPALAAAAEYLRARFASNGEWKLGNVLVVVPGGRAGRRLVEKLVAVADDRQLVLTPPEVVTPEGLPERLYQPKRAFADALTQQLAWMDALVSVPAKLLAPLLPFPPAADQTPQWLAIAESLRTLHTELAADGIGCEDVLKGAAAVEGFAEEQRWDVLCALERSYLETLDRHELWDVQTARLVAIKQREIATERHIVLLGTVDLNRAQRRMLDQVAERATALIVAPKERADRFDEHGCLVPAMWTEAILPLADEQIERVDGPVDQAQAVARWMAALGSRYRADQITVGFPDSKLAPHIERELGQCGVSGRWAIGKQLSETGPYRLLKVAADFAASGRFRDFAALVRHPDVFDWVQALTPNLSQGERGKDDILTALDRFASEHFPARLDEERLATCGDATEMRGVYQAVARLVGPLNSEPLKLGAWAERLRSVLANVYGDRDLDRTRLADRYLIAALEVLREALDALAGVPEALQPTTDARQACRLVLAGLSGHAVAPPANPDAIELLGWLDLPLDDAPAAIVTTFNEGFVPGAVTADAFLPNRLREALGLMHNDRRLARDAYALSVLLASRAEFKAIVAHRDAEGNPLAPSRLLFAAETEQVVKRGLRFFGDLPPTPPRRSLLGRAGGGERKSGIERPRPKRLAAPLSELGVTTFRDYIACPYRFYLRHVLALESLADQAAELDGGAFGDLVHAVLEQFGRSEESAEVRIASEPKKIVEYLEFALDRIAGGRYGLKHARAAVRVQIEQARMRLRAFAAWQAERTRGGWRIVFGEDSEDRRRTLTANYPVDGQSFTLRGRIDRIDYHEGAQKLCVLDYKTADAGEHPEETHRRDGEWIDLQLPLYRHLVRAAKLAADVPADAAIELGYVLLPRDLNAVGLALAEWDPAMLESADATAREIVRAIVAEQFWPPTQPPPDFFDDVAAICQDRAMGGAWKVDQEDAA